MKEYRQEPSKKSPADWCLAITALILSFVFYVLGNFFPAVRMIGTIGTVVFLVLFVQIASTYLLTDLTYLFYENNLFLISRQGKREKQQGSLTIGEGCYLFTRDEWKQKKGEFPRRQSFSRCQSFFPRDPYYLLCPVDGQTDYVLLIFEPDETLCACIRETIVLADTKF